MLVLCVWDQFQINISGTWSTLNLLSRDDFCYGTEKTYRDSSRANAREVLFPACFYLLILLFILA